MTILIYDKGTIYTDGLCSAGTSIQSTDTMKGAFINSRIYGEMVIAIAGSFASGQELMKQLREGDECIDIKTEGAIEAVAITEHHGVLEYLDGATHLTPAIIQDDQWFGGSGADFAMAIMAHGETCPIQTIKTVCQLSTVCGGTIRAFSLKGARHKKYITKVGFA